MLTYTALACASDLAEQRCRLTRPWPDQTVWSEVHLSVPTTLNAATYSVGTGGRYHVHLDKASAPCAHGVSDDLISFCELLLDQQAGVSPGEIMCETVRNAGEIADLHYFCSQ